MCGFRGRILAVQPSSVAVVGTGFRRILAKLWIILSYLWLVGNGGMGYNCNYYYYHSSIPY